MDPRLLRLYNQELKFIREMGGEFAAEFPKIAGRLTLDAFECADPYVERLLESFAFLAARVQLKLEAEFPTFTQHMLEVVYPHFLAPLPSMLVARFVPDVRGNAMEAGYKIPRDTLMSSVLGKDDVTPCQFRTAHDVTLWPVELAGAEYLAGTGMVSAIGVGDHRGAKAAIRLRLKASGPVPFNKMSLRQLDFFALGSSDTPTSIIEQVLANSLGVIVRPSIRPVPWQEFIPKSQIRHLGRDEGESLLPYGPRSFQGYRLLQEYFAFPQRNLFFSIDGLDRAIRKTTHPELEIIILLDRVNRVLERDLTVDNLALNCTPAVNLFPKRTDRIHLSQKSSEHHLIPDRTRPLDFEIYQVLSLSGETTNLDQQIEFLPFYSASDMRKPRAESAYYTTRRQPRMLSAKQRQSGSRTNYIGSEVFVSLVDAHETPYRGDLRQLAVRALCTNRDLPLLMPIGKGKTDLTIESGAPIEGIRVVAGPTRPRASPVHGDTAWRLVSHLSLNYLSLTNADEGGGAAALRDILRLYADSEDPVVERQIEGVRSVVSKPVIRRLPGSGQTAIARGVEVTITFEDSAYQGLGVFLIGLALEQFMARYASINSFTETVIRTEERGEVMRWPMAIGRRQTL